MIFPWCSESEMLGWQLRETIVRPHGKGSCLMEMVEGKVR